MKRAQSLKVKIFVKPHLWSQALGRDRNLTMDTSGLDEFLLQGGWAHPQGHFRHLIRMPPAPLTVEVFWGTSTWEETPGQTQNTLARLHFIFHLAWGCLGIPQEDLAGRKNLWSTLLNLLAKIVPLQTVHVKLLKVFLMPYSSSLGIKRKLRRQIPQKRDFPPNYDNIGHLTSSSYNPYLCLL